MRVNDQNMPPTCGGSDSIPDDTAQSQPTSIDKRITVEGVDLEKLDKLLEVVTSRLGGGGFGDWWIEGNRVSNDTRHAALQEVFALKRVIEDLNTTLEKQGRAPELLDKEIKNNAKAATSMNSKMKETMRTIIAQEMDPKFRDMKINHDRLQERLDESEKKNKLLQDKIMSMETKTKKAANPPPASNGPSLAQHRALEVKVDNLSDQCATTKGKQDFLRARVSTLDRVVDRTNDDLADMEKRINRSLRTGLRDVNQSIRETDRWVMSTRDNLNALADYHDGCMGAVARKTTRLPESPVWA